MSTSRKKILMSLVISVVLVITFVQRFGGSEVIGKHAGKADEISIAANLEIRDNTANIGENTSETSSEFEDTFLTENLGVQIGSIADYYEKQARYPAFSTPIQNQADVELPKPYEQASVTTPLFDSEGNVLPIRVTAATEKFDYVIGESIALRVTVDGAEPNQNVSATAGLKVAGVSNYLISSQALSANRFSTNVLNTVFDTNLITSGQVFNDPIVVVETEIDGKKHVTTTSLQLSKTSTARLENIGLAYINGAFLNIPMQFSVSQGGYYFVQAYLFDAANDQALISIQTEGLMSEGNDTLELQAHFHALKDTGSRGPYQLKIQRIYRSANPAIGELADQAVALGSSVYDVPAFEFDAYQDEAYSDPEMEQRIIALRELAGQSESESSITN